jgi:hypothetical protein
MACVRVDVSFIAMPGLSGHAGDVPPNVNNKLDTD